MALLNYIIDLILNITIKYFWLFPSIWSLSKGFKEVFENN